MRFFNSFDEMFNAQGFEGVSDMWEYRKLNTEPLDIVTQFGNIEDELADGSMTQETYDNLEPSNKLGFWWNNYFYFLDDFVRCHNNPWLGEATYPDYIHGVEATNPHNPLYIETDGDFIDVYERVRKNK